MQILTTTVKKSNSIKNGVIKSIGQTKKGEKAQGTWLYFDEKGKPEKSVKYENGSIKKSN